MKNLISIVLTILVAFQLTAQELVPRVKWKFKTEGPIRSSVLINNGKIYVSNTAGETYCLDKTSSKIIWQYHIDGVIASTPSIANATIYISSRDQYLYALDANTGTFKWKFKMGANLTAPYGGWDYFGPSPLVSENLIYTASGDGHLYALNPKKGTLIWKFKTKGRIRATPLIDGNTIYQPSNNGHIYVLNATNGQLLWTYATLGASLDSDQFGFDRNSIFDQPSIKDGIMVFGSRDGNTYGIDVASHEKRWNFSYGTTWAMATSIHDSTVFTGWSTNHLMSAIDLYSGKEKWKIACGAMVYTKPLIFGKSVYIGSADGNLYNLNKNTGEEIWHYTIGHEIYSTPILDNGILYFGSDDGYLYALEEAPKPYKAVYLPGTINSMAQYLVVDTKIVPYLKERDYVQLDQAQLQQFVTDRLEDKAPSVIVFALPLIPNAAIGNDPEKGLIRQYLNEGGKIVWMGDVPNYYEIDSVDNFRRNPNKGSIMLSVTYSDPVESGNYYCRATRDGLNWGLPSWFKSTGSIVNPDLAITSLAIDELGRTSVWIKKFNERAGSGFISCRTWSWDVPIKEEDLQIIDRLAVYGLE